MYNVKRLLLFCLREEIIFSSGRVMKVHQSCFLNGGGRYAAAELEYRVIVLTCFENVTSIICVCGWVGGWMWKKSFLLRLPHHAHPYSKSPKADTPEDDESRYRKKQSIDDKRFK